MPDIRKMTCSCGGAVIEDGVTAKERKEFDCGRSFACCTGAYKCTKCQTRFLIEYESPEME